MVEFFLEHGGVFYENSLRVEPDQSVRLYPEAPGPVCAACGVAFRERRMQLARTEFLVDGARLRDRRWRLALCVRAKPDLRLLSSREPRGEARTKFHDSAVCFVGALDLGYGYGEFINAIRHVRNSQWISIRTRSVDVCVG